jgi:Zn-dependent protease with chaperone function
VNFFEHQERARRRTAELIVYYALAVGLIILAIYFVILFLFFAGEAQAERPGARLNLWQPQILFWVAGFTGLVILAGTLYKIAALARDGGEAVARLLGGRPLPPDTRDFFERRVLNVVEEMALASGTPVPRVFILDAEDGINAFAAGYSPATAVIGITRGCAQHLKRDELQGVIAHEFSHIFNGDMRLNLRLIGVLNGILVIALIGYGLFRIMLNSSSGRGRSSRDKKGGAVAFLLLGLALMVIGYIGVFFGKLIKSAVSRQREFLADASSVQFTRNPAGIAGALKKIGGLAAGSRIASHRAEEASHLFFANGLRSGLVNLMATHPPLAERIRRIEPAFDGRFPEVAVAAEEAPRVAAEETRRTPPQPVPDAAAAFAVSAPLVAAHAGAPRAEHLEYAAALLAALPSAFRLQVREPLGAQAVVYALALSDSRDVRSRQVAHLAGHADARAHTLMLQLATAAQAVAAAQRLPLLALALPALRQLSAKQYGEFRANVLALTRADMQIDLFEYTLLRMLVRHLDPLFGLAKPATVRHTHLPPVRAQCLALLATLARFGNAEESAAAAAFAKGMAALPELGAATLPPAGEASLEALDQALTVLATLAPRAKRQVVEACTACITADRAITVEEAELLRAITDALDVPLPPLLLPAAA